MKDDNLTSITIQADVALDAAHKAQDLSTITNAAMRHAKRMAEIVAWSKPEAIALRKEQHDKAAAEALELGKAAAEALKAAIPKPLDDLPAISYWAPTFKLKDL